MFNNNSIDKIIKNALKEDLPYGDATSEALISSDMRGKAEIISKEEGVVAGIEVAKRVFEMLDGEVVFDTFFNDGQKILKGETIVKIEGKMRALLMGERTALNFLQRLSGIATNTSIICEMVKEYPVKVTDTRKTSPGLRLLEKFAVRKGGGWNHRFSLSDGVLIKDNHIKAAGGIKKAVSLVKERNPHTIKIEVETKTIEEVKEALDSGADIIMLDNMDIDTMKEAVKLIRKKVLVEVSGNISKENIVDIARLGIDIVSIGSLTHFIKSLDMSMNIV